MLSLFPSLASTKKSSRLKNQKLIGVGYTLFRQEVLDNRVAASLGPVLMTLPTRLASIGWLSLVLVMMMIADVFFASYSEKVLVPGYVDVRPGVVTILTRKSGVVIEQRVHVGLRVKKGQVLAVIQTGFEQMKKTEQGVLDTYAQLQRNMRKDVVKKQQAMRQYIHLANQHFLSKKELAQFKKELVEAKQQLASLTLQRMSLKLAHQYTVVASIDGVVSHVMAARGQFVRDDQVLVKLLPEKVTWYAALLVPVSAIRFVQLHQLIQLRYEAYPFLHYGSELGKITAVSPVVSGDSERERPIQLKQPIYEVEASFVGTDVKAFKRYQGMTFQAVLSGERKPLWRRLMHVM
ncbi:MAG: efflux RND transporter periplasmic adaptor subunit [Gammaproteobacteria bacterium]|nr:efflux RND transporter periplasmic adaptor subunit [Gammaproteobacteria bacterium]